MRPSCLNNGQRKALSNEWMARCTLTVLVSNSLAARARLPLRMKARKISSFFRVSSSSISMVHGAWTV
ncbi:hypothetical protein D3C84_1023850 [compost metagenome]